MVGKQQRAKAIDCPRNEDTCDVTYLMQGRAVEVDLMGERWLRRHLHIIAANVVEGPRAADAEIRTRRGNQRLRALMLFAGR